MNNTATASGRTPAGATVTSATSSTSTPTSRLTAPDADQDGGRPGRRRTATGASTRATPIAYSFLVTNTGAQTVTGVAVADAKVGRDDLPDDDAGPRGEHHVHHAAPYVITQADVDAGSVANTATVSGRSPAGTSVDLAGVLHLDPDLDDQHPHPGQDRRDARPTSTATAGSTRATGSPTASPSPTPARSR